MTMATQQIGDYATSFCSHPEVSNIEGRKSEKNSRGKIDRKLLCGENFYYFWKNIIRYK